MSSNLWDSGNVFHLMSALGPKYCYGKKVRDDQPINKEFKNGDT